MRQSSIMDILEESMKHTWRRLSTLWLLVSLWKGWRFKKNFWTVSSYLVWQMNRHPQVCKSLFKRDSQSLHVIDANYLISLRRPEYSPKGSTRQLVEESLMDYFQYLVYKKMTKTFVTFLKLWHGMNTWESAVLTLSQLSSFPLLIWHQHA